MSLMDAKDKRIAELERLLVNGKGSWDSLFADWCHLVSHECFPFVTVHAFF